MADIDRVVRDGKVTGWQARWRDPDGRQRKKTFRRRVDAETFWATVRAELARGTYVDPSAGKVTVQDWAAQWMSAHAHLKRTTQARYAVTLRLHILPRWGRRALSSISHAEVARWVSDLSEAGLRPGSVRHAHAVLSSMLALAVRDGRITRNPAHGVPLPRGRPREPRFLSVAEVALLAQAAGDSGDVIWFLALTGLRFGETAALRVKRVDVARRRLLVTESVTEVCGDLVWSSPKSHHSRTVAIPRGLVDALVRRSSGKDGEELVFTAPGGGVLRINNWRPRVFDRACKVAGLVGVSPHDLRHTAASLAISAGGNVKAVQRMLGHASAAMTLDVYAGLFTDDLDDVAERLNALVPWMCPEGQDGLVNDEVPGRGSCL